MSHSLRNKTIFKNITLLYLAVFAIYVFSQFLNYHTHILPDGKLITHSHFVHKHSGADSKPDSNGRSNSSNQHTHTKFEFSLISLLTYANFVLLLLFLTIKLFEKSLKFGKVVVEFYGSQFIHLLYQLRAPPVVSF